MPAIPVANSVTVAEGRLSASGTPSKVDTRYHCLDHEPSLRRRPRTPSPVAVADEPCSRFTNLHLQLLALLQHDPVEERVKGISGLDHHAVWSKSTTCIRRGNGNCRANGNDLRHSKVHKDAPHMNEQRCDGCGQQDVPPPWAFVSLAVAIWRGRRIFLWARTAFAVPWF